MFWVRAKLPAAATPFPRTSPATPFDFVFVLRAGGTPNGLDQRLLICTRMMQMEPKRIRHACARCRRQKLKVKDHNPRFGIFATGEAGGCGNCC